MKTAKKILRKIFGLAIIFFVAVLVIGLMIDFLKEKRPKILKTVEYERVRDENGKTIGRVLLSINEKCEVTLAYLHANEKPDGLAQIKYLKNEIRNRMTIRYDILTPSHKTKTEAMGGYPTYKIHSRIAKNGIRIVEITFATADYIASENTFYLYGTEKNTTAEIYTNAGFEFEEKQKR